MEQRERQTQALSEFWDIHRHEAEEERGLRQEIDSRTAAIDMARRTGQIRNAPGFQDFLKAVQGLRDQAVKNLATDSRLTDVGLREQRGRVQALDDVLKLLTRDGILEHLELQKQHYENALAEALRRRPKPREVNA